MIQNRSLGARFQNGSLLCDLGNRPLFAERNVGGIRSYRRKISAVARRIAAGQVCRMANDSLANITSGGSTYRRGAQAATIHLGDGRASAGVYLKQWSARP